MALRLHAIGFARRDRDCVAGIDVDPDQEDFSGGSIDAIFARMRASPPRQHPFALVDGDAVVGFIVLREDAALPDWAAAGCITLHNLRLDRRVQGRALGRSALRLVGQWISDQRPAIAQVMVSINIGNIASLRLALGCGLVPTGAVVGGRLGPELVLRAAVAQLGAPHAPPASTSSL
jgi:RimJ/RimL family protein N-acetyltransferase